MGNLEEHPDFRDLCVACLKYRRLSPIDGRYYCACCKKEVPHDGDQ